MVPESFALRELPFGRQLHHDIGLFDGVNVRFEYDNARIGKGRLNRGRKRIIFFLQDMDRAEQVEDTFFALNFPERMFACSGGFVFLGWQPRGKQEREGNEEKRAFLSVHAGRISLWKSEGNRKSWHTF